MVLLHCTKDKVGTKVAIKRSLFFFFLSGKQCFVHPSAITFQVKTSHEGRNCSFSGVSLLVANFDITVALSKT